MAYETIELIQIQTSTRVLSLKDNGWIKKHVDQGHLSAQKNNERPTNFTHRSHYGHQSKGLLL